MPDALFDDPRLAALYDVFDGDREDLRSYLDIARELGADSVLDVGCGTGSFALLASTAGFRVVGVDPARASLEVARAKPGAAIVTWHCGEVHTVPDMCVDLAVMTGNVAQVFLTDTSWVEVLETIRSLLAPGGHLVYETRRVDDRAWERWTVDPDEVTLDIAGIGPVHHRREILSIELPLVSFRHVYAFPDGTRVASDSTLRFRSEDENREWLAHAGFDLVDVRDAPDRPGRENVYIARR